MKYIFTGILLAFATYTFAAWVPQEKAEKVVQGTISMFAPDHAADAGYNIASIVSNKAGSDATYYIAQLQPQGFVLVSAEDLVYPVLGFSFNNDFPLGEMPEHIAAWMEAYEEQIEEVREEGNARSNQLSTAWDKYIMGAASEEIRGVDPLLMSTWDQGNYYNGMCPDASGGPGGKVYAGCVATAMAQVMYYYRHPQVGTGSSSYFHPDYGVQSANYGNTTYRWNEMLSSINSPNDAIAELLYHCGVAVEMGYSPSGSGAYSSDAAAAYRNYFGYSSNTQLVHKDNYSEQAWSDLLKAQLDAGKPMYYHGYGSGGHAFNVDGYQGTDHFHFNWGWSGSYNGYFYLTDLNPGGSNFSNGQGAIINIEPAGTYPLGCTGANTLTALKGTFEDGSGPISDYQGSASCSWLIAPQQNPEDTISTIDIWFDRFDTEDQADWVTVHQGSSDSDPVLVKYSGDNLPSKITVEGNQALVTFTSDNANESQGFLASYAASVPDFCSKNPEVYTDSVGYITDGSGNKNYNNRSICHWSIEPEDAEAVVLSFIEFETESQDDFLEVYEYDPLTGNGTLLGRYSGNNLPPTLTSNTGAMFLTFFTDAAETGGGWKAMYSTSAVGLDEEVAPAFNVYPNPGIDRIFIELEPQKEDVQLSLRDMSGKLVISTSIEAGNASHELHLQDLRSGIYMLQMENSDWIQRKKLIIR